ncbi:hypothetical protein [Cardiobacterium valvarum]|uniref:hypothetical protein n=1 Tax=Cardiobacterium valvarum TaxID=194702 RepID=UPI0035E525D8
MWNLVNDFANWLNTSSKSLLLQVLMLGFMIKRTRAQQKTVACQALSLPVRRRHRDFAAHEACRRSRGFILWLFVVAARFFVNASPARLLQFYPQVMHNASSDAARQFCNRKKRCQNRMLSVSICFQWSFNFYPSQSRRAQVMGGIENFAVIRRLYTELSTMQPPVDCCARGSKMPFLV